MYLITHTSQVDMNEETPKSQLNGAVPGALVLSVGAIDEFEGISTNVSTGDDHLLRNGLFGQAEYNRKHRLIRCGALLMCGVILVAIAVVSLCLILSASLNGAPMASN